MPVGLSNSACFRNLNALIIWFARQTWLGYGGNGNARVTPPTTISEGADETAGGFAAWPHPPNKGKLRCGLPAATWDGNALDTRGATKSSESNGSFLTRKLIADAVELIDGIEMGRFGRPMPTNACENKT